MSLNKRISEFVAVTELDNTAQIPLVQGMPLANSKITALNFANSIIARIIAGGGIELGGYITSAEFNNRIKTNVPANAKFTDTIIDISGKVDKVAGKSLISNSEIQRLASVTNQIIPTVPTKVSQLQNDSNYITASEVPDLGSGDMTKAIYDTNNDGIVDNAKKVNGKTVEKDVPANAKFTDTVYTAGDNITIVDNKISATGGTDNVEGVELLTNKQNSLTPNSTTKYPTVAAVNAGLSGKVSNDRVLTDVPEGAKFTDTIVDISGKANKAIFTSAILEDDNWDSKVQTVSISEVTTYNNITISAPSNRVQFILYINAGISCISQGNGTLTFECEEVPTGPITVNIKIES